VPRKDTNGNFTRPPGFDLAPYWAESQREFRATRPSYPIVVRVRDHAIGRFRPTTPLIPSGVDGWWIVHTDLENIREACAAVLAQAGDAVVIAPPELAAMVREAAQAVAESHALNLIVGGGS